ALLAVPPLSLHDALPICSQPASWYGPVALKDQAVKTLIKVRSVFPSLLLPQSTTLFTATWEELARLVPSYQALFIDSDAQSRLEDRKSTRLNSSHVNISY